VTALRAAKRNAKLVLAGHPNLSPVVQLMRLVAPKMRTIVCTHGVEVWERLGRLRRDALRRAHVVLAPSRDTAEHVAVQQEVARERIRVLPWALDPQFEALLAAHPLPKPPKDFPTGRVILTTGRWVASERYKGMDTLITALPRLLTMWPELHLALAGSGDDRAWLEDFAEKNGVDRHVHFLSGLSNEELAACYAACEIFALPSRTPIPPRCCSCSAQLSGSRVPEGLAKSPSRSSSPAPMRIISRRAKFSRGSLSRAGNRITVPPI